LTASQDPQTIKTSVASNQIKKFMEHFPQKILFQIFRYIPRLKELSSVCRHWKTAVESYKVFERLSFKEIKPDDINYLVQSQRLYRQLDITLTQKSLGKLMIFLEQSG
jgi:hypothetical protein